MTARLRDVFLYDVGPQIAAMPLPANEPVECEIQLCRTGQFYRADMGHFKVTPKTLERMVANAIERGVDIPINYYHKGGIHEASIEERRSAGRVSPSSLSIRAYKGGQGLFGIAKWTAEAAGKIKRDEVKYISPEIEWSAVRMAASDAGPAGEPIGPMLVGAALVDDPFFSMNPVTFSRGLHPKAKRYNMISDTTQENISKLLAAEGIDKAKLPGLVAQIIVAIATDTQVGMPEETAEVALPAPSDQTDASAGAAQQALAASRAVNAELTARIKELEAKENARTVSETQTLFSRYQQEGRFRVFARADTDPNGEKKAKEFLAKGVAFFREVYDEVPALTQAPTPIAKGAPTATARGGLSMIEDKGVALHNQVMAEIKAKGLKMTDYNRLAAQFSRK